MLSRLNHVFKFRSVTRRLLSTSAVVKVNYAAAVQATNKLTVQSIQKADGNGMLHVTWNNDTANRYPFVYLRDNCQCSECFHESSLQRSFDTVGHLKMDIQPERVDLLQNGEEISVTWPDKHVSVFNSEWLHSRRLTEEQDISKGTSTLNREGVIFWNAEQLQGKIPRHDFHELMEDDFKLYEWLHSLHSVGIALVTNTPLQAGESFKLGERVGYAKTTHYGHHFEVHAKFDANNLAYTSHDLPLHIDLPYYDYVPGVQLLHCIEQVSSEGGANQFVDGFHVAQQLKENDPKTFNLLSTTRFQFVDFGKDMFGEFNKKFPRLIIELDENDQVIRFSFNNHVRDSVMLVSPEKSIQLYEAYLAIGKMMRDPANQIEHKMVPGDMVTFNNSRVLHGRSAFKITQASNRYLQGYYLDWDAVYSRMRVLAKQFNIPFGL
ncbi:Gamma-butyrobetaine dioxygenase [Desmophyllum pertusum]|uniref:Gamma-butyrobetaine dioxygenase n=1 Tax=Desmophyllum pertusum TaxID=174260 RepID=A0A9X0A1G1_9CNID|nr:Gamma-butyrobetaine dioxygenase [Desmophyllum pertusum]